MINGVSSQEEIEQWEKWINESDENREAARLASLEMIGFEFKDPVIPDIEREWKKLNQKTIIRKKPMVSIQRKIGSQWQGVVKIAAIFLIATLTGIGFYVLNSGDENRISTEHISEIITISTEESENKTVRFSNGARVMLNRNSSMSYSLGDPGKQTIEVVLEGEAWFDVPVGISEKQPAFEVRTPDGVIRDIGTQFLVTVKPGHTRVILQDGIVEIEQIESENTTQEMVKEALLLEKGEMISFSRNKILKRERVNPTFFTAWATNFMQFDRTSVREFVDYIEQRFGVKGEITDPEIEHVTLDGAIYFRNLGELVRAVSEVLDIPVFLSEKRDTVYIGRPH